MPQNASKRRDDTLTLILAEDNGVSANLGAGYDVVSIKSRDEAVTQVRLTFTSSEVGNGVANDAGTSANQDAGLAVRLEIEGEDGETTGTASRFDDEGISFVSDGSFTFDIRDLVSGTQRGDQFMVARLGTSGDDIYLERPASDATYINAGAGNDRVTGGEANDFLVGGAGDDVLSGRAGNDSFIGGAGNDSILGGDGDDTVIVNLSTDGIDGVVLGAGLDTVSVSASAAGQVRLTFTSAEVGNGLVNDGESLANQDGKLAVRMQLEDGADGLSGSVSRYDDEGIRFVAGSGITFDVRDLVSGTARGDAFTVVQLGTDMDDEFDLRATDSVTYSNGGAGNDRLVGGTGDDFLVGGAGNDRLNGWFGDDTLLGGGGRDMFVFQQRSGSETIADFVSGTDKIDLRAFGITSDDVTATTADGSTTLAIDVNGDDTTDLTILLQNVTTAPVAGDYLL